LGFFSSGGGLCFRLRSWQVNAGEQPHELRFSLSHFLRRQTRAKRNGLATAARSCCGDARSASAIRSSAMDAAASRPTISITIGLASGVVAAPIAGRRSPSCRGFHSLPPITVCWRVVRPCGGALSSTAPGKRQCPRLRVRTGCPIALPSALVSWVGLLPAGPFLPAPNSRQPRSLAGARHLGRFTGEAVVGTDSRPTGAVASASLRKFLFHPPSLPGNAASLFPRLISGAFQREK
jgi:hypothetical protein